MAPNQYQIVSALSGKCMEVAGSSRSAEANVQQSSCTGGSNQLWQLNPKGLGWYEIRSALTAGTASPMCLDIKSFSSANGANVQQYYCGALNYQAQQWLIQIPTM